MSDLREVADGLLSVLGEEDVAPPPPTISEEVASEAASATIDYVLSRMQGTDDPVLLGEAVVVGAYGAAADMGLDGDVIAEAAVTRLETIARNARAMLEGDAIAGLALDEAKPSDAENRVLAALKKGKKKLKDIASAAGVDVKTASAALRTLQKTGQIDYNLKTGYSVYKGGRS